MKTRHSVLFFFVLCLLLPLVADAGENRPTTLNFYQALTLAGEKSPAVIMADERVRQALEELGQAKAYLFPAAGIDVSENRQTRNLETFGIPLSANTPALTPPFNAFDARVTLTQRIFDVSAIRRLESAGINKELSSAELRKAKEDVMALVGSLYIEARRAHDSLDFARAVLRLAVEKYRIAKVRFSQGTDSDLELQEAKAVLSQARYNWRASATKAFTALTDLKTALGYSAEEKLMLAGDTVRAAHDLPKVGAMRDVLKDHPDIQAAGIRARLAHSEEKAAWAEFFPKVSASADTGLSGPSPSDTENTYAFGMQASLPIFDAGERFAKAEEDKSRAREAETASADTGRRTAAGADEARTMLKDAGKLIRAKQDLLSEADRKADLTGTRYKNGTASHLEFLTASTASAQARDEHAEALAYYRTAQINLAHALGQIVKLSQSRE